ncbi:MAG: hypothetical protein N4A46_11460, partial [Schleiferiaceae bacterium]|nr:hypothetical protein [Schleiferiaceae bacterium]
MKKIIKTVCLLLPFGLSAQSLLIEAGATVIASGDDGNGTDGQLIVQGDLIMNGELTCEDDAVIMLTGDFFRNNDGFTEGKSTIFFNGTAAQEITKT